MHPAIAVPVTIALVVRAYTRKSLTIPGILAAAATAIIHAIHPSPVPFTLLVVFFLLGTSATKVKHEVKANLTLSSTGSSGGESTRTTIQVLANSGIASFLILLHVLKYGTSRTNYGLGCFGGYEDNVQDVLMLGVIANYAAVTADTLSSELGILSKSKPRLITAPWRMVPPGTNGGVTAVGLLSGMGGSFMIGLVSTSLLSFCDNSNLFHVTMIGHRRPQIWHLSAKLSLLLAITLWGTLGSVLDSILGGALQASVVDTRTGKVVEGSGGSKVLTTSNSRRSNIPMGHEKKNDDDGLQSAARESRKVHSGRDLLDNNQVNFLMALLMSIGGMSTGAYFWTVSLSTIFF